MTAADRRMETLTPRRERWRIAGPGLPPAPPRSRRPTRQLSSTRGESMMRMFKIAAGALASALTGVAVATAVFQPWSDGGDAGNSAESPASTASTSDAADRSDGEASLSSDCLSAADIYERLRPAVVEITTTSGGQNPLAPRSGGSGSGIVIDGDGTILANNHVVVGADSLEVRISDGSVAAATVVGRDPGNDLAVVRAHRAA